MDSTQILLIGIIVILTILLLIVGVQAFFVLSEFRSALSKTNHLLDDVKSGTNIAKVIGTLVALFMGKNLGKNFVDLMSREKSPKIKVLEKNQNGVQPKKLIKRFFRRNKPL